MITVIGDKLRTARLNVGISQKKLASIVGVKSAEISQYESNKRTPRWGVFVKLLDILNLTADELLGREINIVSDSEDYRIKLSRKDLELLNAIKENNELYEILISNPSKNVKILSGYIKSIFPE